MEITKTYFDLLRDGQPSDAYYLKHYQTITANAAKYLASCDVEHYYYLVTFTLRTDPSPSDIVKIDSYVKKQFQDRPSLGVKEAHVVQELTKKGRPHWHVSVKTTKPLKKDRFHYFAKIYGEIDISKNKAQNLQDGINYISKSNTPEELVSDIDLTLQKPQKAQKITCSHFLD